MENRQNEISPVHSGKRRRRHTMFENQTCINAYLFSKLHHIQEYRREASRHRFPVTPALILVEARRWSRRMRGRRKIEMIAFVTWTPELHGTQHLFRPAENTIKHPMLPFSCSADDKPWRVRVTCITFARSLYDRENVNTACTRTQQSGVSCVPSSSACSA